MDYGQMSLLTMLCFHDRLNIKTSTVILLFNVIFKSIYLLNKVSG
jgi:hypothetical protein